jgi:hypothetical protein
MIVASTACWSAENNVEVRLGGRTGEFKIVNRSNEPIRLSFIARIERNRSGEWQDLGINYELITNCDAPGRDTASVVLEPHASLVPVPWTGYDCECQCPRECRMNGWTGPGEFRLVVASSDGPGKWYSPVFHLGGSSKAKHPLRNR